MKIFNSEKTVEQDIEAISFLLNELYINKGDSLVISPYFNSTNKKGDLSFLNPSGTDEVVACKYGRVLFDMGLAYPPKLHKNQPLELEDFKQLVISGEGVLIILQHGAYAEYINHLQKKSRVEKLNLRTLLWVIVGSQLFMAAYPLIKDLIRYMCSF